MSVIEMMNPYINGIAFSHLPPVYASVFVCVVSVLVCIVLQTALRYRLLSGLINVLHVQLARTKQQLLTKRLQQLLTNCRLNKLCLNFAVFSGRPRQRASSKKLREVQRSPGEFFN